MPARISANVAIVGTGSLTSALRMNPTTARMKMAGTIG